MAKPSLHSLRTAFGTDATEQRNSGYGNYYRFFDMSENDHAVVRFLPDLNEDNPRGFLVEKTVHQLTINGQKRTVPCMSMYGESCPICELSQKYYNNEDRTNGKKYWRKKMYIAQALVVTDPLPVDPATGENSTGKVRYLSLGYQIYNVIKEAFQSPDNLLEHEPYNFENGYDFIIKKTLSGEYPSYAVGTRFAVRPRCLTPEEMNTVADHMIDLSTLIPSNPGVEKIQAMLNADLTGSAYGEEEEGGGGDDDDIGAAPTKPMINKPSPKPAVEIPANPAVVPPSRVEDTGQPTDFSDLMAKINARRAARQS